MKILRNFLKGASLTTALFVFQACYGTPQSLDGMWYDANILVTTEGGTPLSGIQVLTKDPSKTAETDWEMLGRTSGNGMVYIPYSSTVKPFNLYRFESEDGMYATKDTTLYDFSQTVHIKLRSMK